MHLIGCIHLLSSWNEVLHTVKDGVTVFLSKPNSVFPASGEALQQVEKFKYLWVAFTGDGRQSRD